MFFEIKKVSKVLYKKPQRYKNQQIVNFIFKLLFEFFEVLNVFIFLILLFI